MKFKIDTTIKRTYDIEYVRFDCASNFGAVFTVKCGNQLSYFEVSYVELFNEFYDNTVSGIKEFSDFNLLSAVEYLIERQNSFILNKIILALNDNECEILKFDAYEK